MNQTSRRPKRPDHGRESGLGLAIACAYVKAGASVLLCARDAAMLERARA